MKKVTIVPFNERGSLEVVKGSRAMIVAEKLNLGIKLIQVDQLWLTENIINNSFFSDSVPFRGVRFNFSEFLTTYVVKSYDTWQEYKALNKTILRQYLGSSVKKIVEVK